VLIKPRQVSWEVRNLFFQFSKKEMTQVILGFRCALTVPLDQVSKAEVANLLEEIRGLTRKLGDEVFLQAHPAAVARSFSFDLGNGRDAAAAAAATVFDERVSDAKLRLCDHGSLSEQTLFYNYFSHVLSVLENIVDMDQQFADIREAISSLIRIEDCAPILFKLSWNLWGNVFRTEDDESIKGALDLLAPLCTRFCPTAGISRNDMYSLASVTACEFLGGPRAAWRSGRTDNEMDQVPGGSPLTDQERMVLACMVFEGCIDSEYFQRQLVVNDRDSQSRRWVESYANDRERLFQDFAFAFTRLQEWQFNFATTIVTPDSKVDFEEQDLPGKLGVFKFAAALQLPITQAWHDAVTKRGAEVVEMVKHLTIGDEGDSKVNLSSLRSLHVDTPEEFQFDLDNPLDRQAAVLSASLDRNIFKFKPLLVPRISEQEFYRNYFSHVYAIRKSIGSEKAKQSVVLVGSRNPVKINACKIAFYQAFCSGAPRLFTFIGMDAPSGVSDQPMTDKETKRGSLNRAMHCRDHPEHPGACYFIGIEGGLQEEDKETINCFAWISVLTADDRRNFARTASFAVPPALVSLIKKGIELGRADDIVYGKSNSKQNAGTVGTLTQGAIDRTSYYSHAVVLAMAPFANPTYHF